MKVYEIKWVNPIDDLVIQYDNLKSKKSKEARELKAQINYLMNQEELKYGRKIYIKL